MLVKISGVVKFFDVLRGFGFIAPHNGSKDVFVHSNVVRTFCGEDGLRRGATIEVEAMRKDKGIQATQILVLDNTTALEDFAAQVDADGRSVVVSQWTTGRVKWFNSEQGFGFITLDEVKRDVFLHSATLSRCRIHLSTEQINTCVPIELRYAHGEKGLYAIEVRWPK